MSQRVFLLLNILLMAFCIMAALGCCHDNKVMQKNNDRMQESIAGVLERQEQAASDMRQAKTDCEIMLRIVNESIYTQEDAE